MSPIGIIAVLLLFEASTFARKVYRRESHRHLKAPPLPPSAPDAQSSRVAPFHYDEVGLHEEYPVHQPTAHYEEDFQKVHSTGSGSGGGAVAGSVSYLTDNGLRSIAHGSAVQANSAVVNQNAAGKQAAYVAKSTLAQAAAQAASTAVAVLKGKELLLQRVEEQTSESHKAMEGELQQLQLAKRSAKAAQYAAQQSISHVSVLTAALNNAQTASDLAQKSATEAASELASQIDMVTQAKAKLEQVESHLYAARMDYEETKEAVEKATHSAQEAQINANDAAIHANVQLSESVHIQESSDHHHPAANTQHAVLKRNLREY